MLPLISVDDTIELVISTDPTVKLPKKDRTPTRAIQKSTVKLNGGIPLVFTVRPLNSLETLRIMGTQDVGAMTAIVEACKHGIVRIDGDDPRLPVDTVDEDILKRIGVDVIAAVGNFIVGESIATQDPTQPAASG